MTSGDWREQEARNETVFREMNEWTEEAGGGRFGVDGATAVYLCECSDQRCSDPIRLTRSEYESIRSESTRFAIAVDHENPEIDSVVGENARFATVEKIGDAATRIARATDPRR